MNSPQDIHQWQQDFRRSAQIWYTAYLIDGVEEDTGNFYDSEEAAQEEVEFAKRCGKRKLPLIRKANIHSLDLSIRRWNNFTPSV